MTQLVKYEAACRAVAEAVSIDEAKEFRDQSEAMRAYAKQAKNKQLEVQAAEIRIRAERRIGELMAAQREAGMLSAGTAGAGNANVTGGLRENPPVDERPITLAEAGIDKNLADRARKYAAIPEDEFNGIVNDWKGRVEQENQRVTVNLLAAGDRAAPASQPATPDPHAALRREFRSLTAEAQEDDWIALRLEIIDLKKRIAEQRDQLAEVKSENAALRESEGGRSLGNALRQARAAEGRMKEHQATAARLQKQVNAQKAEITDLKRQLENKVYVL